MDKQLKVTVSFRIRPEDRERILEIGHNSFSKGVQELLSKYTKMDPEVDELGRKIDDLERYCNEEVSDFLNKGLKKAMLNKVAEFRARHRKAKIRKVKEICKEIEILIESEGEDL